MDFALHTDDDLKIEVIYRGTGTTERPGGQHAGTPPTDIRVTHIPTGLVAQCGEHRSNFKNREVCRMMIEMGLSMLA